MKFLSLFADQPELHPQFFEKTLRKKGCRYLAGTDEAGRGALAGPVVAGAVIMPEGHGVKGIKDSKQLTVGQREKLFDQIIQVALSWRVGIIGPEEIDQINIFQASLKAMAEAVKRLAVIPEFLLVDGSHRIPLSLAQRAVVKGDQHCQSVAAASILAKVTRDRLMCNFEKDYPDYRFSLHKGYPTERHRGEIEQFGVLPIHRKSFKLLPINPSPSREKVAAEG